MLPQPLWPKHQVHVCLDQEAARHLLRVSHWIQVSSWGKSGWRMYRGRGIGLSCWEFLLTILTIFGKCYSAAQWHTLFIFWWYFLVTWWPKIDADNARILNRKYRFLLNCHVNQDDSSSSAVVAIPVGGTPSRDTPRSLESGSQDDQRRLQDGVRPVQLLPRVTLSKSGDPRVDVDTPDLFPDECLIHEDCEQVDIPTISNFLRFPVHMISCIKHIWGNFACLVLPFIL